MAGIFGEERVYDISYYVHTSYIGNIMNELVLSCRAGVDVWVDGSLYLAMEIVSVTSTVHVRRSYLSIYQWYMSMYSTYSTSGRREGGRDGG